MKQEIGNMEHTYDVCVAGGMYREKNEVDVDLIRSLLASSKRNMEFLKEISKSGKKDSNSAESLFTLNYELLRKLVEAYILFDKIEVESHQCKNAFICLKHPDLELDWEFMETVRLKRNSINYTGQVLSYDEWTRFKLQYDLYSGSLIRAIEIKLKEFE